MTPPAPPKVISETWFLTLSVPDTPSGRSVEPAINSSPNAGLVTVYSMFVMGSLTTGLLEATAFYKRYMLLCYNDEYDFFSQGSLLNKYTHVQDLKKIDTIEFCDQKIDITTKFRNLFKEQKNGTEFKTSNEISYFITGNKNNKFSKNLSKSIYDINLV